MLQKRIFNIYWIKKDRPVELRFDKKYDEQILYDGKKIVVRMK
jgi:hypothetical protein